MDSLFYFQAKARVTLSNDDVWTGWVYGKIEEAIDDAAFALEGVDSVVTEMAFDRGSETFDAPAAEVEILSKKIIDEAAYYAASRSERWG